MRTPARALAWLLAGPPLLLAWAWVAGSLVYFEHWPAGVGMTLAAAWLLGSAAVAWRLGLARLLAFGGIAGAVWVAAFCLLQAPRDDRPWAFDQARTSSVDFDDSTGQLTLTNVRAFRHASLSEREESWESRSYQLSALRSVDFVIEPLPALPGMAHTLLCFGFEDGNRLAVSVEVRREEGESYSPLAGLFRRYELIYVVGDEKDLLGLRLDARGHDLLVHPLRAEPAQAAALLSSMLSRAEKLATEPEFYDSLSNNCTTNLLRHLNELREEALPFAWQVHLPLHADELAWELDLIEGGASSLAQAREAHRVVGPSPVGENEQGFSRWLRSAR